MGSEIEPVEPGSEVELISDGDGLAVIGNPSAVERFMSATGLDRASTRSKALDFGSSLAQTGAEIAAESGRWVKLTEESAQAVQKFGLMDTKTPGVQHAMIGQPGDIQQWIQVVKSPTSFASNPAILAGGAGIMAQMAMQQTMAEITDYLAIIDEKLDDVLRAQTNQVLAKMDGVELALKEAMSVKASVGRVSDVTWSKVQNSAQTINETQAYALRQIADLAEKLEKKKIHELADVTKQAEADVQKWLYVLARCFELHDAVGVLELDRVLDSSPDEIDQHRLGLKIARQDRLELFAGRTEELLTRIDAAVSLANLKVFTNPKQSPAIVKSSNVISADVHEFRELIGAETGLESSEARPWKDAAFEQWGKVRDTSASGVTTARQLSGGTVDHAKSLGSKVRETGSGGLGSVKQLGGGALGQAKSAKGKLSGKWASRKQRDDEVADVEGEPSSETEEAN